jgi:two-component system, OmpR family, sensor histidine kinase BaeS
MDGHQTAVGDTKREEETWHNSSSAARGELVGLWAAALLLGWFGTVFVYQAGIGINWGIWTTMAAAGLVIYTKRRGRGMDPVAAWAVGLAVLVSWGAAVTADPEFQFFIFVSCVALMATAVRIVGGVPGSRVGVAQMVGAPAVAAAHSLLEAGRRGADSVAGVRGARSVPVARGLMIAVPVAVVFALTLAAADPVLARWRDAVEHAISSLNIGWGTVVFFLVTALVLGAYGIAVRGPRSGGRALAFDGPASWSVGEVERAMVVAAVAGVFGLFLAVQPSYLFRNTDALRVSGVTYTEYAHRGFGELTVAATLCGLLVIALDRFTRPAPGTTTRGWASRWSYWGTLVLIGEVVVVLASAFYRVSVYEAAYGYTALRVYVQAYAVGVAIALVIMGVEVAELQGAFDARRVARRTAAVAMAFLAAFSFGNTEAWVVARNMDRYHATGKLDARYFERLSPNAVPAVAALLSELPLPCADRLRGRLQWAVPTDDAPGSIQSLMQWNLRLHQASAARKVAIASPFNQNAPWNACDLAVASAPRDSGR